MNKIINSTTFQATAAVAGAFGHLLANSDRMSKKKIAMGVGMAGATFATAKAIPIVG